MLQAGTSRHVILHAHRVNLRFNISCFSGRTRKSSSVANYCEELKIRGLMHKSYPSRLDTDFANELKLLPPVVYAGFDPTAKSLHIGNLLVIVNLLRSAYFGIRPIAIVGGATATIGDPSGRSSERYFKSKDAVAQNAESITVQLKRITQNVLDDELLIVDNNEWFSKMSMVDYLRNCKEFRVGEMLRMRAIKARLADECGGISFTEFSYQTMQAYDWKMLLERYDCRFQIGGSDQLGHLDLGAHFIKRVCGGKFVAGVCLPLITDNAGNKLGKSTEGGVWLCPDMTSPFRFYQFFRQLHDSEAEMFYRYYSLAPWFEVVDKLKQHRQNLGKWIAQEALAEELTKVVHGIEGLSTAQRCSKALFQGSMEDIHSLSNKELCLLFGNTVKVPRNEVKTMGDLADCTKSGKIKGSILMSKGAFKVNGLKMVNSAEFVDIENIRLRGAPDLTLICWGKRNFQLVEWI